MHLTRLNFFFFLTVPCCVVKYFLLRFSLYFPCCYPLFLSPTLLCRQESSDYNNGGSSPAVLEPSSPVSHCPPQSAPGTSREEQLAHTQCWLDAQFQPTPCFTEESSHSRIREVTMRAIFGLHTLLSAQTNCDYTGVLSLPANTAVTKGHKDVE